MKTYFHSQEKTQAYFEGWYLKHQSQAGTAAFIPAFHKAGNGKWSASIQAVLDGRAWFFAYPIEECSVCRERFQVKIGDNFFTEKGIRICLQNEEIQISGRISYGRFQKPKYDMMGWFRLLPFLQCNHGVLSMKHSLSGQLRINEAVMDMEGGTGYIETDWGSSFPSHYLWSQCIFGSDGENSIFLSVADVPLLGTSIRGCICAVFYQGKEYRLGTYLGARAIRYEENKVEIRQGRMKVQAFRLGGKSSSLRAPREGSMHRIIEESLVCSVQYRFFLNGKQVFDIRSDNASFEQAGREEKL